MPTTVPFFFKKLRSQVCNWDEAEEAAGTGVEKLVRWSVGTAGAIASRNISNGILQDQPRNTYVLPSIDYTVITFVDLKIIQINATARPYGPVVIQRFVFAVALRYMSMNL